MTTISFTTLRAVVGLGAAALLGPGCDNHDHATPSGSGHKHGSTHGGVAVELGEHQFHLDFLADPSTGSLKAWVMDGHAENFVRVTNGSLALKVSVQTSEKDLELSAQANPTTGETVGDTSQFEAKADWLKGTQRFTALLPSVQIRGQTFTNVTFSYPTP